VYSLFLRKIQGFSREEKLLIENNPKETELKKYAGIEKQNNCKG